MAYADKLRESRDNVQSRYMEFNSIRQKKPKAFIAFLEGYDAPYYLPYISAVSGFETDQIICGTKKKVIAVHDSLKEKGVLKNVMTGFFIDRDFDDNTSLKDRSDYYITNGYSVENYYCSKKALERILISYMHYNCAHKDYDVIVQNYLVLQRMYNEAIVEFNSWYCSIKRNKMDIIGSLDEKMPKDYVKMDIKNFQITKNYNPTIIHHDFPLKKQPTSAEVQKWTNWIMNDAVRNMRGKYEFTFMIEFLKKLPEMVNDPATAFEDHAMSFSIGQKEALSALAQYADRDEDLADYIMKRAA